MFLDALPLSYTGKKDTTFADFYNPQIKLN
jgi:hypothetical protein